MFKAVCSLLLVSFSLPVFALYEPAKTGQKDSYATNDDGKLQLGKDQPTQRFKDNQDGTLTDNLTGLMWIKDSFCANHFISGATSNSWIDSFAFVDALNSNSLVNSCNGYSAKYSDWRVPNINELQSLIAKGLKNNTSNLAWLMTPGNNSPGFTDVSLATHPVWSSTSYAMNESQAWSINLDSGVTLPLDKINQSSSGYIFSAVRGITDINVVATGQIKSFVEDDDGYYKLGQYAHTPRFVSLNDGTVIDKLTGLNWLQDANCTLINTGPWQSALSSVTALLVDPNFFAACPGYNKAEKDNDWRIPNVHELQSLLDYSQVNPSLSENHPFSINTNSAFWTSTSSNGLMNSHAWTISFENGSIESAHAKTESAYAWPVRGPVDFADMIIDFDDFRFNSQYVTDEPTQKNLTITNSGKAILEISSLNVFSANGTTPSSQFTIGRDLCTNRKLDPLSSCTTTISFTPISPGKFQGKLVINSNALGLEELSLIINGDGIGRTEETSNPNCFIATAAYGSYLEPEVKTLRTFRDNFLLTSEFGKQLVATYYKYSPPIAKVIQADKNYRLITRVLLSPIVYAVNYPLIFSAVLLLMTLSVIKRYTRRTYQ